MMHTFIQWLVGNMGTPGNYMYQPIHLFSVAAVAVAVAILCLLMSMLRDKPRHARTLLVSVAVFQLVFEIGWRLIYLFVKGDSILAWWPTYPCNVGGILLPIFALTNCKRGKQMFYLFGFVGGMLTFAMPEGIFSSDVLVFPIVKSILQHTGLLLIPLMEYINGSYRASLRDYGWVLLGCAVHLINCEGIDRLLGFTGDYMFLRSGLPFVIPGVSQFITLPVFAAIVLAVLCFLSDIKTSAAVLTGRRLPADQAG